MGAEVVKGGLVAREDANVTVVNAVMSWAKATTDADSERFADMLCDKSNAVLDFFDFVQLAPQQVAPKEVERWVDKMRDAGLAQSTVYARTSMLSSFYKWLMSDDTLRQIVVRNPVELARPKAPKAYKGAQALTDDEVNALLQRVRFEADELDRLPAKRDYALLLFFLLTGHRREEVVSLQWKDVKRDGRMTVHFAVKGGDYVTEEVNLLCWDALTDYLRAAGRLGSMEPETPLWVGHDRAGQAAGALSSHSFAKNLKRYARDAGVGAIHVHQLRHTVARMVGEDAGDMSRVQQVLGHKNQATTRVYLSRIRTKKDNHSQAIASRLGL